ncbi:glycosyltransferase [Flavobacterium litorale]|uniref:Glycosyl transferase family 28 C-terminal domain-containing protein n=1 Tax=Flavobacterium litorale TaxID=2856519 RepID=A0ABX8V5Y5_9FLAO|nr:glycosyltransferase [Flavobacterium litorale]QYJ68249.1 hypothetical protein K1I41_12090 [Flavobacterium litorale]
MIAYYAHNHGYEHSNAAQQFAKIFGKKSLIITASDFEFDDGIKVLKIEKEDTAYASYAPTTHNLPRYAHYLPKSLDAILHRNFHIIEYCILHNIKFAIIDVSVETAIQFRIAGIPYAYHKMAGYRNDEAHEIAFEASEFLYAYYPKLLDIGEEQAIVDKTHYLGFISRFEFRRNINSYRSDISKQYKILIITGKGDTKLTDNNIEKICTQLEDASFTVFGRKSTYNGIKNLTSVPFTSELEELILRHDIVISSCGLNLTSEILALKNKFIAVPEDRPYAEQKAICKALVANNLAVELDVENIEHCITLYDALPINIDLESYFGRMEDFKTITELKPFL